MSNIWQTMLPANLEKGHQNPRKSSSNRYVKRTQNLLNLAQTTALKELKNIKSQTILLHGITGSGKTEIYKSLARETIDRSQNVIVLVPEISLTGQLVSEFKSAFTGDNVVITHSKMTPAERFQVWQRVLENDSTKNPLIIIGPRSALFLPVDNLGLIVIDECHEPTYNQDKSPKYNALRAAAVLLKKHDSPDGRLILGSATPLVTDYYLAEKNSAIVTLDTLANPAAKAPEISLIDLTNRENRAVKSEIFTRQALEAITKNLENKKQTLIFHNRRGSAPTTLCENCGWTAACPHCFVPETLHHDKFKLICHICGYTEKTPTSCPECKHPNIIHKGIGTKLIEEELTNLFPDANIARFDGDNKTGEAVHDRYQELHDGSIDILIGTQTIAKGLDLPNLTLVVIPAADTGLAMPDFSARERVFQLICQAIGRVGRNHNLSKVIVQSYQQTSPTLKSAIDQNYAEFYQNEIIERQKGHFPPFSYLLKFSNSYKTEKSAVAAARKLKSEIAPAFPTVKILGPTPAFYERTREFWHWQLVLRSHDRKLLQAIADQYQNPKWQINLDPPSLI